MTVIMAEAMANPPPVSPDNSESHTRHREAQSAVAVQASRTAAPVSSHDPESDTPLTAIPAPPLPRHREAQSAVAVQAGRTAAPVSSHDPESHTSLTASPAPPLPRHREAQSAVAVQADRTAAPVSSHDAGIAHFSHRDPRTAPSTSPRGAKRRGGPGQPHSRSGLIPRSGIAHSSLTAIPAPPLPRHREAQSAVAVQASRTAAPVSSHDPESDTPLTASPAPPLPRHREAQSAVAVQADRTAAPVSSHDPESHTSLTAIPAPPFHVTARRKAPWRSRPTAQPLRSHPTIRNRTLLSPRAPRRPFHVTARRKAPWRSRPAAQPLRSHPMVRNPAAKKLRTPPRHPAAPPRWRPVHLGPIVPLSDMIPTDEWDSTDPPPPISAAHRR